MIIPLTESQYHSSESIKIPFATSQDEKNYIVFIEYLRFLCLKSNCKDVELIECLNRCRGTTCQGTWKHHSMSSDRGENHFAFSDREENHLAFSYPEEKRGRVTTHQYPEKHACDRDTTHQHPEKHACDRDTTHQHPWKHACDRVTTPQYPWKHAYISQYLLLEMKRMEAKIFDDLEVVGHFVSRIKDLSRVHVHPVHTLMKRQRGHDAMHASQQSLQSIHHRSKQDVHSLNDEKQMKCYNYHIVLSNMFLDLIRKEIRLLKRKIEKESGMVKLKQWKKEREIEQAFLNRLRNFLTQSSYQDTPTRNSSYRDTPTRNSSYRDTPTRNSSYRDTPTSNTSYGA